MVDEEQDVSPATLELLRILSNLDRDGRPLVQTVLTGQPELDQLLAQPAQRALRQRIAVRAHIKPLTRRQMVAYLRFRLRAAGVAPAAVMTRAALQRIALASGGFPRRANIIADNALIAGLGANRRPLGWFTVGRALAALDAGLRPRRRWFGAQLAWGTAAALALAALGWAGLPTSAPSNASAIIHTSSSTPR